MRVLYLLVRSTKYKVLLLGACVYYTKKFFYIYINTRGLLKVEEYSKNGVHTHHVNVFVLPDENISRECYIDISSKLDAKF